MMTIQDWYATPQNAEELATLLKNQPIVQDALDVLRTTNAPAGNYGTDPVHIALLHAEQAGFQKAIDTFLKLSRPQVHITKKLPQEWRKSEPQTDPSA
jgi:hypothetical protein